MSTVDTPVRPTCAERRQEQKIAAPVIKDLLTELTQAKAALGMLCMLFNGDSGMEEPKKADGAMGTLQFAQRTLARSMYTVGEMTHPLDDLYWGVFGAHSLVSLLEDHLWSDCWQWDMADEQLYGVLSGAHDSADMAITFLIRMESGQC